MRTKGVSIIILNKKNKILLQKRNNYSKITYPGYWGLPGGSIEKNETPKKAIIREVKEETGLDIKNPKLIYKYIHNDKKEFVFFYKKNSKKNPVCNEGQKMDFFEESVVNKLKIRPDDKKSIDNYFEQENHERIVFFGRNLNYNLTLMCYKILIKFLKNKKHKIVLTVCSDDNHNKNNTLESIAKQNNISYVSIKKNNVNEYQFIKKIKKLKPTLFITVQFPKIFSKDLLKIPNRGGYNIHRGWPLRGGSIDERAIVSNISTYNIILHHMNDGIDTGNIIGKIGFKISKNETGFSLSKKTDNATKKLFTEKFLPIIGNPIPKGIKQNIRDTQYASKNSLNNDLDFSYKSKKLERTCRAFYHPRKKGARILVKNKEVFIIPPVSVEEIEKKVNPGTIISLKNSVKIMCADKTIKIKFVHLGNNKKVNFNKILISEGFSKGKILSSNT